MNTGVSGILDDLAGRNGPVEYENSLAIENGDDGDHFVLLPAGTTAQRPTSPAAGMMRWNTSLSRLEYYDGVRWASY